MTACQTERSQFQNKDNCMKMLRSKLVEIKEREHLDKISDIKGDQKKIEWGSQIRSYVFMPYTLAKDTRTAFESSNINAVMDGDIDGFINAYLTAAATGNWAEKGVPRGTPAIRSSTSTSMNPRHARHMGRFLMYLFPPDKTGLPRRTD